MSHKRSVYTLFLETLRPSIPVTDGATFLNLSRRSVTLDTQLKVNNSASRTKTLGSCFCHYEPCPPLPCFLPNPPGAPVAPHTGPIGGPCPWTGLARKPVWVWWSPAVSGTWPGWDQPHCICSETPGVLADCIWPRWWTLPQPPLCVHVNSFVYFFILHLKFTFSFYVSLHLSPVSGIDRA